MTSRAGVLPSSPLVRRCMRRCQWLPCARSPVHCRSEACHEAKGWATPVPTTTPCRGKDVRGAISKRRAPMASEAEEWARGKARRSPAGKKRKPRRSGAKVGIQSVASRSPSPRPFLATPICRFQSSYCGTHCGSHCCGFRGAPSAAPCVS